jgi:hypothetical protein
MTDTQHAHPAPDAIIPAEPGLFATVMAAIDKDCVMPGEGPILEWHYRIVGWRVSGTTAQPVLAGADEEWFGTLSAMPYMVLIPGYGGAFQAVSEDAEFSDLAEAGRMLIARTLGYGVPVRVAAHD